ncbi:putative lipoprotein [Fimbriiglobus ruber]|uniref:Putative lipoprotein n=1 Tax=Fimbriiglobus ruber TaxID=1908690 RepID=A0A225DKQ9_9BACT|nr:putative lipoprotein [Fimbriiglobus ruber]
MVTGISTGSLIAPFAFLGSEYDPVIQDLYTNVRNPDIFEIRRSVRSFFAESVADNAPLKIRVDAQVTYDMLRKVAGEHAKGRRLYVGSTNLDTKRLIVWDMGVIATRGTEEARRLFVDVIIASATIPGFFPSARFHVTIDGVPYEEMHVDGGVTRALFFRPPFIPASETKASALTVVAGSNLYSLVAGKIYPDPEGVRERTVAVVGASVSNLLYATTRGDLYRFYTYCMLTGMNYFVSAIPPELKVTNSSTNFDPAETRKMFSEGYKLGAEGAFTRSKLPDPRSPTGAPYQYADGPPILFKTPGPAWRDTPPGLEVGERIENRAGLTLTVRKPSTATPHPQGTDQNSTGAPPVAK